MAEFNDSDTWSESVDSYFSTDDSSSSSSLHCPTPRKLMDLIADKLRFMKCVRRGEHKATSTGDETELEDQGHYLHPHQLASLLREKLERLNAASVDETDQHELTVRKVSFLDLPTYLGSGAAINTKAEQIMDVDFPPRSGVDLDLPSSSADAANEEKLHNVTKKKLLRKQQQSIFLLNFPELNVLVESVTNKEDGDIETPAQLEHTDEGPFTAVKKNTEEGNGENDLPSNKTNGEVRMYGTGRVTIAIGENVFDIAKATRPPYDQDVTCVALDEAAQTSTMTSLGMAQHYIDAIPTLDGETIQK